MKSELAIFVFTITLLTLPMNSPASDGWTGPGCYNWETIEDTSNEDMNTYNIIISGPYDTCDPCFAKRNSEPFKQEVNTRWPNNWGGGCGIFNTQANWDWWVYGP